MPVILTRDGEWKTTVLLKISISILELGYLGGEDKLRAREVGSW
jgi:hypothetical protein